MTKIADEEWQELARRAEILRPLVGPMPLTAAMVATACDELELRKSQFYALLAKFKADPRVTSLLPAQRGPRKGECRIAPEVCALIDANIEHRFLTRQKLTVAALYDELQHDCQKAGLPVPSERTVRRRIAAIPPSLVMRTREGAAAARQRFTPLRGSLKTEYPLDVVQIDHTLMDLMILDEVTRQSIGRVWLTVLLDVHTRVVCGFYISPEHPCTTSVALTIAHAVLPKGPWLRTNGINLPWPVEGLPRCIHVDNAREFHSKPMARACQQHGIFLDFRPPGLPHFGGHIERLMGTLMKRVHELAGTTFSNIRERGDADPEASAVLTLSELQRVFALEVLGPYHHEVHSGIGMPPLAAWSERMAQRPHLPALPHDPNEFLYSFLPFKEVTVRREGIRLHSIFYNDDCLPSGLMRQLGVVEERRVSGSS